MNKLLSFFLSLVAAAVFLFSGSALCQEMSKQEIIKELNALKERTKRLEEALMALYETETSVKEEAEDEIQHGDEMETNESTEPLEKYIKGVELSGTIEVEAVYEHFDPKGDKKENSSDLTLETVDLAVDAFITDRIRTHVLFEYEEGEDLVVDKAIIHFQAEEVCVPDLSCNSPWYASIGRLKIPFGYFESHFITDLLTENLGESNETAVVAGIHNPFINIAAGVFNGDLDKAQNHDHIERYVAAGIFTLPEDILPNVGLMTGVSYISNIADSDNLTDFFDEEFGTDTIEDDVAGFSSFLSVSLMDRFFFEAEYVGSVESFEEDENFKPKTWNFQFAFTPIQDVEVAILYGGSSNTLNFLPDTQFGIAGFYEIFNNTSIGLEYLYEEFENDDKVVRLTTQLAVEF